MPDTIIVATISAMVSLIVALLATSLRNRADLLRVQKEQEHGYAKALFDKRVEYYPQLFNYLSDYAKVIRAKKHTHENLAELKQAIDEWNSKHALFFTPATARFSAKFRFLLGAVLNNNCLPEYSDNDWENIRVSIRYFEKLLKTDIGIFVTKPVEDVAEYREAAKFIDQLIDQSQTTKKMLKAAAPENILHPTPATPNLK